MGHDDMTWRLARSSRPGTAHLANALPCQDRSLARVIEDGNHLDVLVVIVSDGAGSASHSHVGAGLICETALGEVQEFLRRGGNLADVTRSEVEGWLAATLGAITAHAESNDLTVRDLAATCLGCLVGPAVAVCFQIGDGAIVVDDPERDFAPVFWPQRGEYANTTVFLCDPVAIATSHFALVSRSIDRVAVFSDGLQMVALHYASQTAHAPFFASLFPTLETQPPGESETLNWALEDLLDRKSILDRTDDDRTLVIASRRPAETGGTAGGP